MNENSTSEELVPLPIEEQISLELVKANVTEAVIADLKERLLPLKIAGIEDKETYLIVKEGRKECKALRVAAKKICTNGREQAVVISKAWIAKEKEVTGEISKVEDYLEKQEVEYEAEVAKEKEIRKRKQEEQLIMRQQTLSAMGVLYTDGCFSIGDVSFEFSLIKESEEDVWQEAILPKFKEEYEKVQAEQIEKDRLKAEGEAEFKRQQEALEQKEKELSEQEIKLKEEAYRQAAEAKAAREAKENSRMDQLISIGLKFDFTDHFIGYDCFVPVLDIMCHDDEKWTKLIDGVTAQVSRKKEEEAEEKRKEQERKELQSVRFNEMHPYKEHGINVPMDTLWALLDEDYQAVLGKKKAAFDAWEEARLKKIADDAAQKERERIEEEQRQADIKKKEGVKAFRNAALSQYGAVYNFNVEMGDLGEMSDDNWWKVINSAKELFEETKRRQEEERKAEELAKAGEKVKWATIIEQLSAIEIPKFQSGQYNRKVAILREKLEEIKAL